jgi:hypothetical protein
MSRQHKVSTRLEEGQVVCSGNCGNPFLPLWIGIIGLVLLLHSQQGNIKTQQPVKAHQEVIK